MDAVPSPPAPQITSEADLRVENLELKRRIAKIEAQMNKHNILIKRLQSRGHATPFPLTPMGPSPTSAMAFGADLAPLSPQNDALTRKMQAQINYILDKLEHGKTNTGFREVYMAMYEGDAYAHDKLEEYFRSPVADILLDTNNEGMTLLHQAAATGCVGCARRLLEQGAKANVTNRWNDVPMDYAIAFGPESDIVQALILGGADPLSEEYLKKFDVEEAFERPKQKGWGGARNRGSRNPAIKGLPPTKEERISERKRLEEAQRFAEAERLKPRVPVHLNDDRHDHIVREKLLSKEGYRVNVYKYKKGIFGSTLMKSARSLRLSNDCHTLILRQMEPAQGKEPTELKLSLSDITRIYRGIQTRVLHRVFPGMHNRDDEELRCGTIVHDNGPGTEARDLNLEFLKVKARFFNYMEDAVKHDHSEAIGNVVEKTIGATDSDDDDDDDDDEEEEEEDTSLENIDSSNIDGERGEGKSIGIAQGGANDEVGGGAPPGDVETDIAEESGALAIEGGSSESKAGESQNSLGETSPDVAPNNDSNFNVDEVTSQASIEWEGDPEGCMACLEYLIRQIDLVERGGHDMDYVREWHREHDSYHGPFRVWHESETARLAEETAQVKENLKVLKRNKKMHTKPEGGERPDQEAGIRPGEAVAEEQDDEARQLWGELDVDGDGDVSFDEFKMGMQAKLGPLCPKGKALREIYVSFLEHHGSGANSDESFESRKDVVARQNQEKSERAKRKEVEHQERARTKTKERHETRAKKKEDLARRTGATNDSAPLSPKSEAARAARSLEDFLVASDCIDYLEKFQELGVMLIEHLDDMEPGDFEEVGLKKLERKRLMRFLKERIEKG